MYHTCTNINKPDLRSPEEIEAERIAEEQLQVKWKYILKVTRRYNERKRAAKAAATNQDAGAQEISTNP